MVFGHPKDRQNGVNAKRQVAVADPMEIDRREGFRLALIAGSGRVRRKLSAGQNRESFCRLSDKVSSEVLRRGRIRERRARTDDPKSGG